MLCTRSTHCLWKNNFIPAVDVTAGNVHESVAFESLYEEICKYSPEHKTIVADITYKAPHICKEVFESGRVLSTDYKRPPSHWMVDKNHDYVYAEFYDCVICPENKVLHYSTTNREGYREYRSRPYICQQCPTRHQCTENAKFEKNVTRHIWQDWLQLEEDARYTARYKELYRIRQEKIECVFADAKEKHGMRYAHYRGLTQVIKWMKLKSTAMNLKKLAVWKWNHHGGGPQKLLASICSFWNPIFNVLKYTPHFGLKPRWGVSTG